LNTSQSSKKTIAVPGEHHVAGFTRKSRLRHVTYGKPQDLVAIALHDDSMQPNSGDFDFRYRRTYGWSARHAILGLFKLASFSGLIYWRAVAYHAGW